jgi:putative phosphoesterase
VISDTHGNIEFWNKALEFWDREGINFILHAGDILHPGPKNPIVGSYNPPLLIDALNSSKYPIYVAEGNCDSEVDHTLLNLIICRPFFFTVIEGLAILVNHGHRFPNLEDKLAQARRYQAHIFIFGHTHSPLIYQQEGILLLNPGASLPLGEPKISSFATLTLKERKTWEIRIYNTKDFEIYQELTFTYN